MDTLEEHLTGPLHGLDLDVVRDRMTIASPTAVHLIDHNCPYPPLVPHPFEELH
jgi:hypothetical protein